MEHPVTGYLAVATVVVVPLLVFGLIALLGACPEDMPAVIQALVQ